MTTTAPTANEIRRLQRRRMYKHLMALQAIKDEGYSLDIMLELAFGPAYEQRKDLHSASPDERRIVKELYQEVLDWREVRHAR